MTCALEPEPHPVNHEGLILAELQRLAAAVGGCQGQLEGLTSQVGELRGDVRVLQALSQGAPPSAGQGIIPPKRTRNAVARDAAIASTGGAMSLLLWNAGTKLLELLAGRLQ